MRIQTSIAAIALSRPVCEGKGLQRSHIELSHSWTEIDYVNAVTMHKSAGFHHSNWYFVKDAMFEGPDGFWRGKDRGFEELAEVRGGGVVAAPSTQAPAEVQGFPEGAASYTFRRWNQSWANGSAT